MVVQFKLPLITLLIIVLGLALFTGCKHYESSDPGSGDDDDDDDSALRPIVYELVVRYFGNVTQNTVTDGDIITNGVGRFESIDDTALKSLAELGVTHIWLMGVLQQATDTDYYDLSSPQPKDDPDILKGKAGSFYAVKDYFDVCPDYALDPENRMAEFEDLVERIHEHGMKVIIDLVPNHVARSYASDVRPDLDFGAGDDVQAFYLQQNNFFYLVDPPGQSLHIPEPSHWQRPAGADGTFAWEDNDGDPPNDVPKATGNNQTSPDLSEFDWYETVKLNYGYNFVDGQFLFEPTPDTWLKMDDIVAYWQDKGVDGFRCDFAHWVPLEYWEWLIDRSRNRDPGVYFFAEAYDNPDAVPGFSFDEMIKRGFDAVYGKAPYDTAKGVLCCGKWANDLDETWADDYMTRHFMYFSENHDECRLASSVVPGDSPHDSGVGDIQTGFALSAILFLQSQGPILLYNGQEVGEEGSGTEGFSLDDGRTTIFDYWSMPRMIQWVNNFAFDGGGLDQQHSDLRAGYAKLLELAQRPAMVQGSFYSIQYANKDDWRYGGSGQWVYSFLRYLPQKAEAYLVVVNLSDATHAFNLKIPEQAVQFMGFDNEKGTLIFTEQLDPLADQLSIESKRVHDLGLEMTLEPQRVRVYSIIQEKD